MESLLENEREWRRFLIERVELITKDVSDLKSNAFTTRVVGGGVFAIALIVVAWALGR